jgi:hypothetical protein
MKPRDKFGNLRCNLLILKYNPFHATAVLLLLASTIRELRFININPCPAIPSHSQIAQPSSYRASPNCRNPNHRRQQIGEEEWAARQGREWWHCTSDQLSPTSCRLSILAGVGSAWRVRPHVHISLSLSLSLSLSD